MLPWSSYRDRRQQDVSADLTAKGEVVSRRIVRPLTTGKLHSESEQKKDFSTAVDRMYLFQRRRRMSGRHDSKMKTNFRRLSLTTETPIDASSISSQCMIFFSMLRPRCTWLDGERVAKKGKVEQHWRSYGMMGPNLGLT
mmetsp:Transcript_3945/g.9087  ORF Transcript_3945/g.9087 Transcript_3945/m.9087 type:complete len:140 (-) Transcript_3945:1109-1528(-)